jgi:tripartite-type tricarboxylate transporter receptor subunit TctC
MKKITSRRTFSTFTALVLSMGIGSMPSWAQSYPDKPVKLIVGFAPGTGPDVLARTLSIKLSENLKQPVLVDNKSGAGGQIAALSIAKAVPDGYSLLIADVSAISIAPSAFTKLQYDPAKELVAVSEIARTDFILVVPANSPYKTVADFVKAAKANPGKVNFGTFGAGTPGHFGAEVFADIAGFKVEPIHYRATGDAVTAIVTGDVQGAFVSIALGMAQIKGGKMRGLATTAPKRSALVPDVPTFIEAGFPKADFSAWFAVFVPAGTPASIIATLNAQVVDAVQSPDVKHKLEEAGFSVSGTSAADAKKMIAAENSRWDRVVKASGFKAD